MLLALLPEYQVYVAKSFTYFLVTYMLSLWNRTGYQDIDCLATHFGRNIAARTT
jgi:hypothetical protein